MTALAMYTFMKLLNKPICEIVPEATWWSESVVTSLYYSLLTYIL